MRGKALVVLALAALLTPLAALPARSASYCFGLEATISALPAVVTYGTPGNDVIVGTGGPDTIYGNGGRDAICGRGGDDTLYGGPGRDRIAGEDGNDTIVGGAGHDQILLGGAGDDTIRSSGESDKAYGGPGDDSITGKPYGQFQELYGGSGNDRIFARMMSMNVSGGLGNDIIRSYAGFVDLHGDEDDDRIYSGYRNGLDAGAGFDRCSLDMDVPATGCERVTLICAGSGEPLPPEPPADLTTAHADFDGNGVTDDLYVWKDGSQWVAHLQTDGGFGAEAVLPTSQYDVARAIGGHDVNGDGVDEAFLQVATGASTTVLGIYTLYETVYIGDPPLRRCGLVPVSYAEAPAETSFVIGGPILFQNGLQCRLNHTLREYSQDTTDGYTYTQHRYDYDYLPGFGITGPVVHQFASNIVTLHSPADDTLIALGASFTCGTLSLYP